MAFASGYFKTAYAQDLALVETRVQKASLAVFVVILAAFPFFATPFHLDLANQVFIAVIGSVALMLLTGFAGQISLGHAGLLAAGAFTTGILFNEIRAPFWVTVPAAGVTGALLGVVFGLPSLRLKGLYLAISTLALHFVVVYIGNEYETQAMFSTGIVIDPPSIGGWELYDPVHWYFVLLAVDVGVVLFALNLLRARTGRAWAAIHDREVVAEALGIPVHRYKLLAFVVSSALTSVAGALIAYKDGFVSVEAYDLFLTIEYVAMVIIGGLGSILGAILGAIFVVIFPYGIEWGVAVLAIPPRYSSLIFALNFAAFGVIMILFLLFEPEGLVGIWRRIRDYFLLWPFRHRPLGGGGR